MNLVGSIFIVILFALLIRWFKLIPHSNEVIERSRESLLTIKDSNLSDDEKEARLQKYSVRLIILFVLLVASAVAALFIPIGIVWLLGAAGVFSFDGVLSILMGWKFILIVSVIGIGVYYVGRRLTG